MRRPSPLPRRLRRAAIALVSLIGVLAILFVSLGPTVESSVRPTAGDLATAREVWQQLKVDRGTGKPTRVRIDNRAISGLAVLAGDATGLARFEGEVTGGVLSGKASLALPAGLWINASATVSGVHTGFPAYRLKVGRVPFPLVAGRWIAHLGRWMLRLRGADIPPLDEIVRRVSIDRQHVLAELALPKQGGLLRGVLAARGTNLNDSLVSEIYCRLAAEQRATPVANLSQLVRRTFDPAQAAATEEYSRAAFVALSFLVVGERIERVAPRAAELAKDCPRPNQPFALQQREDLAMHWAFSAGLTAVLGGETASSLGEWKELDDSLPNGSGFSFVDLAADRSGMQAALRALDRATVANAVSELGRVTEDDLLPPALLQAPEGLSEASFADSFSSLDRERYREAVASIDQALALQRSLGAAGD